MCPSRKHKPHSRLQQGFKGKGREVQKVKAADEIDDKKWLRSNHPPLHRWRSHSFIIECRVMKICFLFHQRRTASLKAKQTLNTFSLCAFSFIIYFPSCHSKPSWKNYMKNYLNNIGYQTTLAAIDFHCMATKPLRNFSKDLLLSSVVLNDINVKTADRLINYLLKEHIHKFRKTKWKYVSRCLQQHQFLISFDFV